MEALQALTKAELHVHLEGSITPEVLLALSTKNKIDLHYPTRLGSLGIIPPSPALASFIARAPHYPDFGAFIGVYVKVAECIVDRDDIALIAQSYAESARAQNIKWSEIYFSPSTFALFGRDLAELFWGLKIAQEEALSNYGVHFSWIFDVVRNTSRDGFEVLESALTARKMGVNVTAIGIAGDELAAPSRLFARVFEESRKAGFKTLAHSGELGGPDQIRETVEHLRPVRIGHGVQILRDSELVEQLAREQIPLEVSPWSNICLSIFDPSNHPLVEMLESGLSITLAADDPGLFGKSLTDNYRYAFEQGIPLATLRAMAERSVELAKS